MPESRDNPNPSRPFPWTKVLWISILILFSLAGWFLYQRWERGTENPLGALLPAVFQPLPLGSVQPEGWLLDQMKLQAGGLSGHLDEFWPDVKDSGWIGGKAEGWERAPYWLDGLVPLAYELNDAPLKAKAGRWINYILAHQTADGWLGPEQSPGREGAPPTAPRDPWPQFIILKVLSQYGEATGDPRIIPAMERSLQSLNAQLDQRPLFAWNFFRWGDLWVSLFWLYDRTKDPWLLDLAWKVHSQGYDWPKHFSDLPVKEKSTQWNWEGHVVNNAMGLKIPALLYRFTGSSRFKKLSLGALKELDRWHGEPNGLFSGDECLAGKNPSQGTELCAIVETMFSLENSLSVLGEVEFADRLEKVAFNALPAAITPDYWGHQYVEQANQVACLPVQQPIYTTNRGAANLFGLEPQYGCCLANMHQGWPKLVSHLWMRTQDGGLAAAVYAPSKVETTVSGIPVKVELATDYPFGESLVFTVTAASAVEFPLYIRVPGWTKAATLRLPDGTIEKLDSGTFQKIQRKWTGEETLVLNLPMSFRVKEGFQKSMSVERGPLVYSLRIEEDWRPILPYQYQPKGKKKSYFALLPKSQWNYALELDSKNPDQSLQFQEGGLKGDPFTLAGAPATVRARGRRLDDWNIAQGAAEPPPLSPVESLEPLEDLILIPYGSTRLRVTAFPVLK